MKFGFDWPSNYGEDLRKWWTDDGRWQIPIYYKLAFCIEPTTHGYLEREVRNM